VGVSPLHYHERCRMQQAAKLLRVTNLKVGQIAEQLGFPDPFYFSTRFRHHLSASPRAFRSAFQTGVSEKMPPE